MEYIICSAIHYNDGKKYLHQPANIYSGYVLCGQRHHAIIYTHALLSGRRTGRESEQGFLTSKNRFVSRKEAAEIAFDAGQTMELSQKLYSEDIF